FDLDAGAARKCDDLDRRPRRVRLREAGAIDFADSSEIRKVDQKHRRLDDRLETDPSSREHGFEVGHHTLGLRSNIAADNPRLWTGTQLAGAEDELPRPDCLGVRAYGSRCSLAANRLARH